MNFSSLHITRIHFFWLYVASRFVMVSLTLCCSIQICCTLMLFAWYHVTSAVEMVLLNNQNQSFSCRQITVLVFFVKWTMAPGINGRQTGTVPKTKAHNDSSRDFAQTRRGQNFNNIPNNLVSSPIFILRYFQFSKIKVPILWMLLN